MRTLRFRKPVICQNGHKAFWYYEISNKGIAEIFNRGVPREVYASVCDCPKFSIGEGWAENGDDEQMTGLKDKNGVEIYKGDIVDLPTPIAYDTRHIKAEVVYESARFSLRLEPGERDGVLWSLWRKMHLATVIGNIYENPELLGGTDDTPRV